MKDSFRVYVHGLGAVGSSFAARIQEIKPEWISVILDERRMQEYKSSQILVNGKPCSFRFVSPEMKADVDLIIIAVKYHQLAQSIKDIKNFVGENTIILALLNGITSEDIIARRYGNEKLLHSFVVGIDAVREGKSVHYTKLGRIVFGDAHDPNSKKTAIVRAIFDRAGVPYEISSRILHELWWKFMLNVGVNQVSAVLRAPYAEFQKEGEARELMLSAFREVVLLSRKTGVNLHEDDIDRAVNLLMTLGPDGKTSMLQDIEAGRRTEVDMFAGTVVELGKKHGVPTPVNAMLLRFIRALEEMQERRE